MGAIEKNSTTFTAIDLEATDGAAIGSYVYINTPWTVLSAVNAEGAKMLDEAKAAVEAMMTPSVSKSGKPKMPKGPLGRHALLLRGPVEPKVVSYGFAESRNVFAKWMNERSPVEEDGRRGYFDITPEMLMPHQRAALYDVQRFAFLGEAAPGATNMELNDVRDL
jgi:hypothetical protein